MDVRQKLMDGEWWVARRDLDALLRDIPPGAAVDPEKLIAGLDELIKAPDWVEFS